MASPAEIDGAFRFLLGRPPSTTERREWAATDADVLRERLMSTEAFRAGLPAHAVLMPLDAQPGPIGWRVDRATAIALLARVQQRWTRLGQEAPHWSIDRRAEFLPVNIAANRAAFDASGANDLALDLAVLARYGLGPNTHRRVFEFGCGVGRVTQHLPPLFAEVAACDVSAPHLALAREATGGRVPLSLSSVGEFGMARPFDLWLSTQTLQHNPPPVIAMILQRAFTLLAPGGVALFQLPTVLEDYSFDARTYLSSPDPAVDMELHVLPQAVVFALAAEAGCVPLEVRDDGLVWPPTRCTSNRFLIAKRPPLAPR